MNQSKIAIISPHTDDAIFSMAQYIYLLRDTVTICSPFAGIPDDEAGKIKHITLRKEHGLACDYLEARYVNGDFLDDVYPMPNLYELKKWLEHIEFSFDAIYLPLGIHHPDHLLATNEFLSTGPHVKQLYFYEELPYRVLYPELAEKRLEFLKMLGFNMQLMKLEPSIIKRKAVRIYDSQIKSESLINILDKEQEYIWKVS